MPAGKRQQSDTMLYTLVAFVGLFIIATIIAVIYYVKFEEQKRTAIQSKNDLAEMASSEQWQERGKIIGGKKANETYLGNMTAYLDKAVTMLLGPLGTLQDTSAEVKIDTADKKFGEVLQLVQKYITENIDPNTAGLVPIIQKLQATLDNTINTKDSNKKQLDELQRSFDAAMAETRDKEKRLEGEKEQYHQQVADITQKYQDLKLLMEKTSDERVKLLSDELDQEKAGHKKTSDELLKTQAELNMARDRMERALSELQKVKPSPQRDVAAYKPDGKVLLVDDKAGVAHLNIGIDDHVYQGLTFTVYDRDTPIQQNGIGKAEVEVFAVNNKTSSARIIPSLSFEASLREVQIEFTALEDIAKIMRLLDKPFKERSENFEEIAGGSSKRLKLLNNLAAAYDQRENKKRPIIPGDIVANLIWDSAKTNTFIMVGEFDLNGDGITDSDAIEKIKALIGKWGGKVADNISIGTDFLIIGSPPQVPPKPTFEETQADPMAEGRYEAAMQKLNHYKEIQNTAQTLWIPVFTYDRFLSFIGYQQQANKTGGF
jgi:hypothetical protein